MNQQQCITVDAFPQQAARTGHIRALTYRRCAPSGAGRPTAVVTALTAAKTEGHRHE